MGFRGFPLVNHKQPRKNYWDVEFVNDYQLHMVDKSIREILNAPLKEVEC